LLAYEPLTAWRARCPGAPKAPPPGREALDAVSATWSSDGRWRGREDDGRSRALRRRVTL